MKLKILIIFLCLIFIQFLNASFHEQFDDNPPTEPKKIIELNLSDDNSPNESFEMQSASSLIGGLLYDEPQPKEPDTRMGVLEYLNKGHDPDSIIRKILDGLIPGADLKEYIKDKLNGKKRISITTRYEQRNLQIALENIKLEEIEILHINNFYSSDIEFILETISRMNVNSLELSGVIGDTESIFTAIKANNLKLPNLQNVTLLDF